MNKLQDLIINHYEDFTDSDKYIAKYILNHSNSILSMNIEEIADCCSVSKSTIVRFTKKIGLDGFIELKVLIKMNSMYSESIDEDLVDRACDNDIQVINYYRNYNFIPIIEMLDSAPVIYAYGTGRFQRSFVIEIQRLFMHIGIWIKIIEGTTELDVASKLMQEDDVLIVTSSSGENALTQSTYDLFKLKGVKILSFTNSANNTLAYNSNYNIATELNKETFYNKYYFDNINTMYLPLKILFAHLIKFKVNDIEESN